MNRVATVAALVLAVVAWSDAAGAAQYEVGPRGDWVAHEALDELGVPRTPSLQLVDRGTIHLLFDRQIDVRKAQRNQYTRIARRFVDQIGILDGAQIEIPFDPAFQSVVLHGVHLIRSGRVLDRLDRARVHVIESDSTADTGVYDGTRSLVVLVPDVRVGDTLEYEYTTVGSNPVFGGHLIEEFPTEWDVPLGRLRLRVLAPRTTPVRHRAHGSKLAPAVIESDDTREWTWTDSNVAARLADDALPSWYRPYAFVEMSDFSDWEAVASWASMLFSADRAADAPGSELDKIADAIGTGVEDEQHRVAAALGFVQDEIRYLAVEIGENSHAPTPPRRVLERRFGDCKDKALLLVTLLEMLGIKANVALVSVRERDRLERRLPSPLALDHAVVRVDYGDGTVAWVDPTLVYQRGDRLPEVSRKLGQALVVDGRAALEDVAAAPLDRIDTEIVVDMALARGARPAWMRVDTVHRGAMADNARREIRASSVAAAEKAYRDYYAGLYPSLSSREPMRVHDDEAANEVRLREEYRIDRFWTLAEQSGRYEGELYPLELANLIALPRTRVRTMPLAVEHPRWVAYTIRAEVDLGWAVEPSEVVLEDEAVRFVRRITTDGDVLIVRYEYRTRRDHVTVEESAAHIELLERIRRLLAYPVSRPLDVRVAAMVRGPSALNWPKVFAAATIALFAFSLSAIVVGLRFHPVLVSGEGARDSRPRIGGFLNLVILALAVLVVGAAQDLLSNILPTLEPASWLSLTSADSAAFHPFWAPYLTYAILARTVVVAWLLGVIAAFLRSSTRTPALAIAGLFLTVVVALLEADCFQAVGAGVVDQVGLPSLARARLNLAVALGVCAVTAPYLLWSRRSCRTFGVTTAPTTTNRP